MSSRGPQYTDQGRSYAKTKEILSDATLKPAAHQLSKPLTRIDYATRRMDYDDDDQYYYYDEDYSVDYGDYTYHDRDEPSSLDRRQGEFSEQEELLELAGNTRKLTKEKVTKSGKNYTQEILLHIEKKIKVI